MKRLYQLIVNVKGVKFSVFFAIFLFTLILGLGGHHFSSEAAIPQGMSIEYKAGKVSAKLKGVQVKDVFEDMAKNTGIEFLGLDKVTGTIEELEFHNLSLEEAIRTLGEDTILIFSKEGPQGEEMKIKKVIFVAQREEEEQEKQPPTPLPPPTPVEQTPPMEPPSPPTPVPPPPMPIPPPTPPQRPTPPSRPIPPSRPTPAQRPTPPPRPIPPSRPTPPQRPMPPSRPTPPPLPTPPSAPKPPTAPPPVLPPSAPEPRPAPQEKPAPPPERPKTVSRPKTQDANLIKGEKFFKEKRWDLAIKYYGIYMEKYPEDKESQHKLNLARKNTNEAISLYNSGKAAEKAGNYREAYRFYKNSYELYPLLYDTWERMKKMQKRL